jgi:TolB-like protein/DNA-binding winged helix-turn-helix (wHTH) protein/Tfp pilus assembly protein PilF
MSDKGCRLLGFGRFTLDVGRESLLRDGEEVRLRPKSFAVLRHLVEHAGQLVTKDQLMEAVWGGVVVTEGSLTQCIIDVRRALEDHDQRVVRTVARRGFIFELPVQPIEGDASPRLDVAEGSPAEQARSRASPAPGARHGRWMTAMALLVMASAVAWWQWAGRLELAGAPPSPATVPAAVPNSIAVLRFADLSPGADQGYFADGLAEEILHLLAQAPELRVAARTSSFAVEPAEADVRQVARQLGVAHVLEGSVRRVGDDLRITVQLIDGSTGAHAWSRTYDRRFDNILQMQREVATDVAAALHVSLLAPAVPATPQAARAQDLFLLGRHLFHRRRPGDLEAAVGYLEEAVRLDPGHARGWTALAGAYAARAEIKPFGQHRLSDQREALERALALDPGLAEAHLRLARVQTLSGEQAAAEASFERALALAPDDPLVLTARSNRALVEGKFEEALHFERRAVEANPLSAVYRHNFGIRLLAAGRLDEGLAELLRARELSSDAGSAAGVAEALLLMGRAEDARRELAVLPPGVERDKLLVLLADDAQAAAARSRLDEDASFAGLLRRAEVAAYEGRLDEAFRNLDAGAAVIERGDVPPSAMIAVYSSPLLGKLRDDSRWTAFVERMQRIP